MRRLDGVVELLTADLVSHVAPERVGDELIAMCALDGELVAGDADDADGAGDGSDGFGECRDVHQFGEEVRAGFQFVQLCVA